MEFTEKFIEKNIGELCMEYDKIRGANVNIARISPMVIDGLKPVQRRTLYILSTDKYGGKKFRKLASISGDTFGKIHPHAITSIDNAVVGIEQPWKNTIPLIEGGGNFGCHDCKTEVLTKNGWKFWPDATMDDEFASIDPKTGKIIFEKPTKLYSYDYDGEMIIGRCKFLDFKVTLNHKMMIHKFYTKKYAPLETWKFTEAYMLPVHFKMFKVTEEDIFTKDHIDIEKDVMECDNRRHIHHEHYKGKVYCAKVPSYHTLVTRRNGFILVSGNSIGGDEAGASRYITARLSDYAISCFFEDWKDSVVDMTLGADEETWEPMYLPAKYPNILLNGCLGIGYGMSANFAPFNFKEVINATITLMRNPNAKIILIPDSPTGADIIETDFGKICETGIGSYKMRCKYEIDPKNNIITITHLPYMCYANNVRSSIADLKEKGELPEINDMNDKTNEEGTKIELFIRDDVNPYKLMKKLLKEVKDLEQPYPVTITAVNEYQTVDYSISGILLEWIQWRREQKRVVVNHKHSRLLTEKDENEVKLFILNKENLEKTINIFRSSKNRTEVEKRLMETYHNSEIKMDSMQARTISEMRFIQLTEDEYNKCLDKREKLEGELKEVEDTLNDPEGIDKLIIAELRDGAKKYGVPRRSNVIPYTIKTESENEGYSLLQLSSDGTIKRNICTNVDFEPIPTDINGFAIICDNNSSFIIIDENAYHSFIKVSELPFDYEVPVNRYGKNHISGNIIAMLPFDIDSTETCTLISKKGIIKRFKISEMKPTKKPFIALSDEDKLVKGIVTKVKSSKDILVFTKEGMGQRIDPNSIRITSVLAKGIPGFKLLHDDEIIGCYRIDPDENQYLLYVTMKGKMRLNNISYLPTRESKHDKMVSLININERDRLLNIVGCNKFDKVSVYYTDGTSETIDLSTMEESTMSMEPKKMTEKNAVSNNIVKVKLI